MGGNGRGMQLDHLLMGTALEWAQQKAGYRRPAGLLLPNCKNERPGLRHRPVRPATLRRGAMQPQPHVLRPTQASRLPNNLASVPCWPK